MNGSNVLPLSHAGLDWKPDLKLPTAATTAPIVAAPASRTPADIDNSIKEQGDKIRKLKDDKAPKVKNNKPLHYFLSDCFKNC